MFWRLILEQWDKLNSCEADELMTLKQKLFGTTEDIPFDPDDPYQARFNEMMIKVFGKMEGE
jgi:hypothetical protein